MAQRVEPPNPLQEAYACLLPNGLDGASFYPSAFGRGSRSEHSVNLALAEMYVQGVSTRKVIDCAGLVAVGVTEVAIAVCWGCATLRTMQGRDRLGGALDSTQPDCPLGQTTTRII
jgi:hypothetical protein